MTSQATEGKLPTVDEFLVRTYRVSEWLQRVTNEKIDTEKDFYRVIKDGILMCTFLKFIDSRLIPRIVSPKEGNWKLRENVEFFLDGCERLGVPRHKVFSVHELMRLTNTIHVLECLESLEEVLIRDNVLSFEAFDINTEDVSFSTAQRSAAKKQIGIVKDAVDRRSKAQKTGGFRSVQKRKLDLLTVGIRKPENTEKFKLIQRVTRGYLARERYRKKKRMQDIRNKVSEEILSSEEKYVAQLGRCIEWYLRPTQEENILTQEETRAIFGDVEMIHAINTDLLESLKSVMIPWDNWTCVGDTFKEIAATLKLYTGYVGSIDKGLRIYRDTLKKNKLAIQFFEERRDSDDVNGWDLPSYLIVPVQRIPRYQLLLREMVKYTWSGHPDLKKLKEAESAVRSVGNYMNERKRDAENSEKVLKIQGIISGKVPMLISPGRYFVNEGPLTVVLGRKKKRVRYFFLFTDILVSTKPKKNKERKDYEGIYSIQGVLFQDTPDFRNEPNIFELFAHDHSWHLTLEADSKETKMKWKNMISHAVQELEKSNRREISDFRSVPQRSKTRVKRRASMSDHDLLAHLETSDPKGKSAITPLNV